MAEVEGVRVISLGEGESGSTLEAAGFSLDGFTTYSNPFLSDGMAEFPHQAERVEPLSGLFRVLGF